MTLAPADIGRLLVALALLLSAAHGLGYALSRIRQPRVIGEILGGLLLGPTVFGALFPEFQAVVFPASGSVPLVLDAIYQLGLLLLMFCAGVEIRAAFRAGERRTVAWVGAVGTVLPFLAGLGLLAFLDLERSRGPAATGASFLLVFAIAIAVTSIPVISRIMLDLGILETSFARIVLAVAVLEDVFLYVLLAIALGLAARGPGEVYGLPGLLDLDPSGAAAVAYHVAATLAFLGISLVAGPPVYRRVLRFRYNVVRRGSAIGFQLVFMFLATAAAVFLDVVPLFGAFVAGIVVASSSAKGTAVAREEIKNFSFAFFIPIYFAIVGLRLDLVREFDPLFFLWFSVFACVAKSASVYLGARASGESAATSTDLAIALNARGGPGIVLASVALDADIISETFYSTLVLLAIATSIAAGSWLERAVRTGRPLRHEPARSTERPVAEADPY
jgi:Kef-type K+ transport system membrane component KefB